MNQLNLNLCGELIIDELIFFYYISFKDTFFSSVYLLSADEVCMALNLSFRFETFLECITLIFLALSND